jgi:hypothetical protein
VNGVEAGLGSTGVGIAVEVLPNEKALLDCSAVAVVSVGRLNLNPPVLVAEAGVGAGTASGAAFGAASAPKVKLVVLEAPVDPIAGKSNSFVSAGLDLPSLFRGGMIEGIFVSGVAVKAGADPFIGDPLSIPSSRAGGVLVCSRAIFAGVGCRLGAAVGAVNTIVGAGAGKRG